MMNNIINLTLLATLLSGCCLTDYRPTIEKVAKPTLKELEAFYKTNKRFPNTNERDVMLEKAGCEMKGNVCMFGGKELTIVKSEKESSCDYSMSIEYQDKKTSYSMSSCGFRFCHDCSEKDKGFVICSKRPCIQIRQ